MIAATKLEGIIVPIVTPVNQDQTVDYDGLRRVVRHVLEGGVHGLFALGGTGNFCSFTLEERLEIARAVVQEVSGQVPVLMGCMASTTRLAIHNTELAYGAGVDAVVMETPFYYLCTDADVLSHFTAIAEAAEVPVVIYHNPIETKVRIDLPLVRQLATMSKIIGIKDSSYDFVYFQAMLSEFSGAAFSVLQGQEPLAGPSFLLGGQGAILALGNVVPRLCVRLLEAGTAGKLEQTRQLQDQLMMALQIVKSHPNGSVVGDADGEETTASFFAGLQCAMDVLGLCRKVVPLPYPEPSPAQYKRVHRILTHLDSAGVLD